MSGTIDLREADSEILEKTLRTYLPPSTRVWVFGSRARGTARRYSDLDLAIEGDRPLDLDTLRALTDALSESDLTIKVDVVDLLTVETGFRRIIEAEMIGFPPASGSPSGYVEATAVHPPSRRE